MARVSNGKSSKPGGNPPTVSHREKLIEELRSDPFLAAEYLNAAAEDDDPRVYLLALRTVAEAQGIAKIAKAARVPRESVYRALSANGNPRFTTLFAILKAAGFRFSVENVNLK
ncbi:MAG: addiction module antidote protein [Burkholderiales bacterium]